MIRTICLNPRPYRSWRTWLLKIPRLWFLPEPAPCPFVKFLAVLVGRLSGYGFFTLLNMYWKREKIEKGSNNWHKWARRLLSCGIPP